PAQRLVAVRARPFLAGEQARGGAVGERGGVAGGQRAAARRPVEGGLERGQLVDGGVGTQDVVARNATEADHQVVEETALVGRRQLAVRGHRQLVLRIARDVP